MKPSAFEYHAPTAIDEAISLLAEHGPEARVLAGGQSLVRLMNARSETPSVIIDINRIPDSDQVTVDGTTICFGPLVRQRASETSPVILQHAPVFSEAGAEVAHVSVRERGTVVGSLAYADPCAELPTAFLVLDGEVTARSARGDRVIAARDFFHGPYATAVADDEILTEARITALPTGRTGSAFIEITRRHGELPVCGVATVVRLDDDGLIAEARISVGGVGQRPTRASAAESELIGQRADDESFRAAGDAAAAEIEPRPTVHGSTAYRQHLTTVVTRRSLARAAARAAEGA
ncbi:xanthine dehydrogenase family protein subunit M [Rhodococcus aerolatus]